MTAGSGCWPGSNKTESECGVDKTVSFAAGPILGYGPRRYTARSLALGYLK